MDGLIRLIDEMIKDEQEALRPDLQDALDMAVTAVAFQEVDRLVAEGARPRSALPAAVLIEDGPAARLMIRKLLTWCDVLNDQPRDVVADMITAEFTGNHGAGAAFLETVDGEDVKRASFSVGFCSEVIRKYDVPFRSYFMRLARDSKDGQFCALLVSRFSREMATHIPGLFDKNAEFTPVKVAPTPLGAAVTAKRKRCIDFETQSPPERAGSLSRYE